MSDLDSIESVTSYDDLCVLYCEDSEISRIKMSRFLSRRIPHLIVAHDGKSGLELFENHRPQLVITDIHMPEIDGITLCQTIHKQDPNVVFIFTTAHNEPQYLHASIDLPVVKYLVKPISLDSLMASISKVARDIEKQKKLESQLKLVPTLNPELHYEQEKVKSYINSYMQNNQNSESIRYLSFPKGDINGDFHCIVKHEDSTYILIADGTGHGLAAVMPALQIPTLFKVLAEKGFSILSIADEINHVLYEQNLIGHFIAATLVRINPNESKIEVLNCGNPTALLINKEGQTLHQFKSRSLALGTVGNDSYDLEIEYFDCNENAQLYVFTDGLADSLKASNSQFNLSRFDDIFTDTKPVEIYERLENLIKHIILTEHVDDITLLEISFVKDSAIIEDKILSPITNLIMEKNLPLPFSTDFDSSNNKNSSILYVEDDDDDLNVLTRYLERRFGIVFTARNGVDGLTLFHQHKPSIVITDLHMPGLDGLTMIEEIHKHDPSTPVIVISGSEGHTSAEKMFEYGVTKYLRKPIQPDKLVTAINACLKNKHQENHLKLSASVFLSSSLAITITDRNKELVSVNPAFSQITGFSQDEVIGRNPKLLSSGKHDAKFYQAMWHSINTKKEWSGEVWNRRKNGDLFLEWITINAITNELGEVTHYFSVFSDITERKAAEEAIRKLTYHDSLTGLPNRRLFLDRLEQEIKKTDRSQQSLAVIFLDLDNFKDVNDTLGHNFGDQVLQEAASRLTGCVRETDTVARLGGDEFTICLPNISSTNNVDIIAQHILKAMSLPFKLNDELFYLSASLGISLYPDDAITIPNILKNADQAMFFAKQKGRNCAHYFRPEMEEKAIVRKEMIQDLRIASEENQFTIFYQPIIEMQTGAIHKAEALIRWEHPSHGFISPVDFIPIAEDCGIISKIGDWVFKQAALQASVWRDKYHHDFQISINKSPKQFQSQSNSHQDWFEYLEEIGLSSNNIIVEITEGMLMDSNTSNTNQLLNFRDKGIQVSLDDFGTGYSSLSYLKKFDIDFLKIDQSFVRNLSENSDDHALCEAIIVMSHKLGIKVVAEGIETQQQFDLLKDAGCDFGQGYLFSKPVTAEGFELLLHSK